MKSILIPFDSSATSENVISYVRNSLKQITIEKIFILQCLQLSIFNKHSEEAQEERNRVDEHLKKITEELQEASGQNTQVRYAISDFDLFRAVHEAINSLEPELIIIGSDSYDEESLVGNEVISISKTSPVPVLVVPSGSRFERVENALVPCNFGDISNLSLLEGIATLEPVNLRLLNVDPNADYTEERDEIEESISDLLKDYKHSFYYSDNPDIVEGILDFTLHNDIQMVIALPGKHSFFYRLTHTSITQALTQNSNKPVLLLKEIEE